LDGQYEDGLAALEERYAGYEVYDRDGENIGRVGDLFVDKDDRLQYIGVKIGLLRTRSVLIPMDVVRVDGERRVIEVSQPKSKVEEGPTFDDAGEITPEFEERVRSHYEHGAPQSSAEHDAGAEESYTGRAEDGGRPSGVATDDFGGEHDEVREHPASADREEVAPREAGLDFTGYQVYDMHYEKIGKVDDLFVNESDRPEYIGVKMGFLGTRSTLIPMDIVRVNDKRRLVEVEADKDAIKEGPTFSDDREITPEFEQRVLSYYHAETAQASAEREAYGPYYPDTTTSGEQVDVRPGERAGAHKRLDERQPEGEVVDADREHDLIGGEDPGTRTPERQEDRVNVRKRMPADHRHPAAPEGREEVPGDHPANEGREV
jgi:sporulation protein YlmC with PRC-barrel domain